MNKEKERMRSNYFKRERNFYDADKYFYDIILSLPKPIKFNPDGSTLEQLYNALKLAELLDWFEDISNAWSRRNEAKRAMEIAREEWDMAGNKQDKARGELSHLRKEHRQKCG